MDATHTRKPGKRLIGAVLACIAILASAPPANAESVARIWNEQLLDAIRLDFARPTVHARNLYHVSIAMWDAWAAYGAEQGVLYTDKHPSATPAADRQIALSHAAYRILTHRFADAPNAAITLPELRQTMLDLGLDPDDQTDTGDSPVAIGNRIAQTVLAYGLADGSNEQNDYANLYYEPVNPPLLPDFPGNPDLLDWNRWQPLALEYFVDQSGNIIVGGYPDFLSPEWGLLEGFALTDDDRTDHMRDGDPYPVFHDPGPPPAIGGADDQLYKDSFAQVVEWSALLDPADGVMIDISPRSRGNNTLGTNDGTGHAINPATGQPYDPVIVPAGDYYRVLAEFWADGPDSETPPGHWYTIANQVSDHPALSKRIGGVGPVVGDLEWDVKLYLMLGGAVHDAAISAWSAKGWYDFIRPISAIRAMCDAGQSSDPLGPSYSPLGIPLRTDVIEVMTAETIAPGGRHHHLAGDDNANLGKIAIYAWRGPEYIDDPATDVAGVGWILCENWWPYQRPTFVTPPFAGYVSGHSTFSRAAAEVMTAFTGSPFFPGGLGVFDAPANEFLVFEEGPSVDVTLQWATYQDAADECSLSRIYGGIHPPVDDIPGRLMGYAIGHAAAERAFSLYQRPAPIAVDGLLPGAQWLLLLLLAALGGLRLRSV